MKQLNNGIIDGTLDVSGNVTAPNFIGKINGKTVGVDVPVNAKFTDTVYSHPATHSADMITDGTTNKAYTSAEKTKLSGIATNANNYSHPTTHPPSIIVQNTSNRFVTDTEKSNWNGKLNASSYTASDVLTKIKTVDGSGSGLDADLLDGQNGSYYTTTSNLMEPAYVRSSTTKTSRPLFDVLRADRTAFLPATQIIIEQSTDAGVTWTDAGVSDTNKARLFTGQRPSISIPLKGGVKSTDCMIRVTITGMRYNQASATGETDRYNYWNSTYVQSTERYFAATDGWVWLNSNRDCIYMKAERATGASPNTWHTDREAYMSGWSGGNYFSLSGSNFGGGTTQTSSYWNWRFTFRTCSSIYTFNDADLAETYTTSAQAIHHIKISGQNVWNSSNNYMYHDHLYNWDESQNAFFPAQVSGTVLKSTIPTGTSPLTVISTTVVPNLNADLLDGKHASDFALASQVLTNVPSGAKFTDTVYTHPTTAGNKHIPTGGTSGQVLKYNANGTAVWGADNDTITTINGKTGAITKADIVALGIPAQDTNTTYSAGQGLILSGTSFIMRSSYGTCTTAAATVAKVATITNFALYTGAVVYIKFTHANTATAPTLNISGTGAKYLRIGGEAVKSGHIVANRVYGFVYDGSAYEALYAPTVWE